MKKRGISLIVLIVTIIVIIILAAAVILTLNKNNPIGSAKEASFKEDVYNFKTELELYKAKISGNGEDVTKLNANKSSDPSISDVITSISRKYIDKLEVREGKLVYVGKDREEYLISREINLLPEDELLDDDILTELKPFITEWTVEAGDSITLPVGGTCNFTVDYGDGTGKHNVTYAADIDRIHTYENAGTYIVLIEGVISNWNTLSFGENSRNKLTKIIQWGTVNMSVVNFFNCTNLEGSIPEPSKNSFKNLSNVQLMFYGCFKLNCEIPERLFFNCPKILSFKRAFTYCGFIGSIPEKLFSKCPNVTDCSELFRQNTYISGEIPEKLFANNPKINDVQWCFSGCTNLTGDITNLFNNNPNVTNFTRCFSSCNNLTGEAPKLWERDNITNGSLCFLGCTKLSNYAEIPDDWKK